MKIGFHSTQLDIRGTCVSLYDYAHYYETILGGKSVIITQRSGKHDENALYKFAKRFEIRYYSKEEDIDDLLHDCGLFYNIKYGKNDGIISKKVKTCVHCVFDMTEPHGDVYAGVSDTLAKKFGKSKFVPHMIGLPPSHTQENLREKLKIPSDAIVFGRHGGTDTFDLNIAKTAIIHVVNDKPNFHFIFVNTPLFYYHPRIHHINKIVDLDEKNRFIMSCDAMIHAQNLGETFGIAIGEFSVNNKPIIAYNGSVWNDHYKNILGDRALWYTTEEECYDKMFHFNPKEYENKDMNCYKQYSPEIVMQQFKEVFIDSISNDVVMEK
jgi:hypothetical protein